ncbi:MAG: hypothetical protein AB8H47_23140 [Bacteroidia bacterium]
MTNESTKIPVWFWIVAGLALAWNLVGCFAYVGQVMMTDEALAVLPEAERALYENVPAWVTAAFAFAVWGGALGSLLLLLRKKIATPVLIVSAIGITAQLSYNLFMSKAMDVYGPEGMIMPVMVLVIGLGLIYLSRFATQKNWLR